MRLQGLSGQTRRARSSVGNGSKGFGFDVEVLYLARRFGYDIGVVPLRWEHKQNSRVAPIRDTLRMLSDVARVRVNAWRGAYA